MDVMRLLGEKPVNVTIGKYLNEKSMKSIK